ncbi:MAG: glycosyltransferase family 4 protein, partial [Bacteroidota bacterium]
SEMRDFPTLLAALKDVDIRCHIAAGTLNGVQTPWVNTIERVRELPPNVTVGGKTPAALRELYARSRFVVIPLLESDTDNGITCILEAMAMGKPVICSRIKGQVDVIQDGKTGIFVPVGDSKALREAILYLWNNPKEAERMGRAGRKYVEECQTLDKFVSNLHAVVKTTIAVRNPESVLSTPKNSAMLSNAASTVAVGEE